MIQGFFPNLLGGYIDLICHGVPSQHLWNKYLKEGYERYGYGLSPSVNFRDKTKGWRKMYMRVEGEGKKYVMMDKKDLFYRFFLLGNCYMKACYECDFRTRSSADIRIGDYWGPRYKKDKEGVSMVISISETGNRIIKKLKADNIVKLEKKECIEYWTVQHPQNPIKPTFYEELIRDLGDETKSLKTIANFYCSGFEFYEKIKKPYRVILSLIKKGRNKNEQKI